MCVIIIFHHEESNTSLNGKQMLSSRLGKIAVVVTKNCSQRSCSILVNLVHVRFILSSSFPRSCGTYDTCIDIIRRVSSSPLSVYFRRIWAECGFRLNSSFPAAVCSFWSYSLLKLVLDSSPLFHSRVHARQVICSLITLSSWWFATARKHYHDQSNSFIMIKRTRGRPIYN
jgi:hypothetical protein